MYTHIIIPHIQPPIPWKPTSPNWMVICHDQSWYIMINHDKSPVFIMKNHQQSSNVTKNHQMSWKIIMLKWNIFDDLWWSHFHDFWWFFAPEISWSLVIFDDFWWSLMWFSEKEKHPLLYYSQYFHIRRFFMNNGV